MFGVRRRQSEMQIHFNWRLSYAAAAGVLPLLLHLTCLPFVCSVLVVCEIGESMEFTCCKVLTPSLAPLLLLLLLLCCSLAVSIHYSWAQYITTETLLHQCAAS
jgi:hypothetical protein